jgi:Raf kinase inhibitor-like YbhB/YbcL family protein
MDRQAWLRGMALLLLAHAVQAGGFVVWSDELSAGAFGPAQEMNGFGCHGGNRSPRLEWSGAPPATRSFALTMFDPDARAGAGWWHWIVSDIPAFSHVMLAGNGDPARAAAKGMLQLRNDFGLLGYGGPCPPPGSRHHYRIVLSALKVAHLDVSATTTPAQAAALIQGSALGSAVLEAEFGR